MAIRNLEQYGFDHLIYAVAFQQGKIVLVESAANSWLARF
jgi:hypothetical protein